MNDLSDDNQRSARVLSRGQFVLTALLCLHIIVCCVSLIYVSILFEYQKVVFFDTGHLFGAIQNVALFALVAPLFVFGRFSFGYFIGFYFYTVILGYLWLLEFSRSHYDHSLAHISILLSALAFLLPALLITSPARQRFALSAKMLDLLLLAILLVAATTVAVGALYNFRLVGVLDIYKFRDELQIPKPLGYAIGMTSSALLPFAFAGFVARGNPWRAAIALLLLLLLYPVTLTKLTLLAPFWLLSLWLLSRLVGGRASVVLSLLLPIVLGIALIQVSNFGLMPYARMAEYTGIINARMIAFPSIAIDVYNEFFAGHDLTHFCQVSLLKPLIDCPYAQPLSVLMEQAYHLGNFNASLFATEGIASVGLLLAPLSALVCGLVIALGNRLSSGLPPTFILLSSGILTQILLNVPLTTTLLTNGAAILFLLWYVMPRSIFEHESVPE